MKHLTTLGLFLLLLSLATPIFAGPNVSGGDQESRVQYATTAIKTIFENFDVINLLAYKGDFVSVTPGNDSSVFIITTTQCELHVRFIRTCEDDVYGMPQCKKSSEILLEESKAIAKTHFRSHNKN